MYFSYDALQTDVGAKFCKVASRDTAQVDISQYLEAREQPKRGQSPQKKRSGEYRKRIPPLTMDFSRRFQRGFSAEFWDKLSSAERPTLGTSPCVWPGVMVGLQIKTLCPSIDGVLLKGSLQSKMTPVDLIVVGAGILCISSRISVR